MPLYDEEALEKFRLSGKILRETREEMRSYVHENMPIIEVCEKAEALIRAERRKTRFSLQCFHKRSCCTLHVAAR